MGTSTSAAQLARKFDRMAQAVGDTRKPLEAAGKAGKVLFLASAGPVVGTVPTGKRKPIGARYDLGKRTSKGHGEVVVTYTGPAHLVNNPTREHFISARRQASRTRSRKLAAGVGAVTAFGGTAAGMFGTLGKQSMSRGGALRGGARSLTIGGDHAAYAFHPGTKGKGFAQKAKAAVRQTSPQVYRRAALTSPLKEVFR